jgi:hypothetical protein
MRHNIATSLARPILALPRGWMVLGMAVASWAILIGGWTAGSALFSYVANAI